MSFAAASSRQLFRRSAHARLAMPHARFESTANTASKAAKNAASSASSTAKTAADTAKATAESAAAKAAELQKQAAAGLAKAQEYSKQAAEGLAKAGATAQAMTKRLSQSGGRTGAIAGVVDKQIPLVVYYFKVVIETAKIIFNTQKMAPPPMAVFQSYGEAALAKIQNPAELIKSAIELFNSTRGMTAAQIAGAGVLAAECLGFFTVGEMIGRAKIIGYRGKVHSAGHH